MKILFIGDIFAKTGRRAVQTLLPSLKQKHQIDLVIANAENATHCKGLSKKHYYELMDAGIDFFTMGNHTWSKKDIYEVLDQKENIVRPCNIITTHEFGQHGVGTQVIKVNEVSIRITNLMGQSVRFNDWQTNPFFVLDNIIKTQSPTDFHIVDFHAETTSEKNALFYAFQGKVSAIFGTHTHVQTADNRIRNNTAFITDAGSTGPADGIIGGKADLIVKRFKGEIERFILDEQGGYFQFCAVILELDEQNHLVKNLERIYLYEQDLIDKQ